MDTTMSLDDGAGSGSRARRRWCVGVVHHESAEHIGAWAWLPEGEALLGRASELLGAGALVGKSVSREHAKLNLNALGELSLEDLESRNGTFVNGRPVERVALQADDVVSVGEIMLLVQARSATDDDTVADSAPWSRLRSSVERLAEAAAPVLLCGETGAGKDHIARQIHQRSQREGPFVAVRCGALDPETVASDLLGRAAGELSVDDAGRPGLLETADGGTLYLDAVHDAPDAAQAALLAFLDSGEVRRSGESTSRTVDVRVVASTTVRGPELASSGLKPEFAARLQRLVLEVPALRERRDEVLAMARREVEAFAGCAVPMHRKLRLALLRHRFPGNVRELQAVIEAAVVDHDGDGPLELTLALSERLRAATPDQTHVSMVTAGDPPLVVAESGAWFELDGQRSSLESRTALRLLVAALVARRQDAPGAALNMEELLAVGWPGEKVLPEAGRNRVFVALTALRKLGLRRVLVRDDDGYFLDPRLKIRVASS